MECNFAIIEFGSCEKDSYIFLKGSLPQTKQKAAAAAHTYWYPDDITNEEANQEVLDLMEQYEIVAVTLPLLEHIKLDGRIMKCLLVEKV